MEKYIVNRTDALSADCVDWNKTRRAELFSNNGGESPYRTAFMLAHNGEKLFFRFECEDDEIKATMTEFNAPLYDEETIELFISSGGDIREYLEFEMNALKGVFLADAHNDMSGHVELKYCRKNTVKPEVIMKGSDWTAIGELNADLFKGAMDGEWRFNAYRIKRDENGQMILMAYSPTYRDNFHMPEYFAALEFER